MKFLNLIIIMMLGVSLNAQTGTIRGEVSDKESGELLPFVKVTLTAGSNVLYTMTDFDGIIQFKDVAPGTYSLRLEFIGMEPVLIEGIIVKADRIALLGNQSLEMKVQPIISFCCCYYGGRVYSQEENEAGLNLKPSN